VLIAFSAPQLPLSFLFTIISLYLLKYSTDVLLISPAIIGLVFGLSRFWDALTDPVIGFMSDRTSTRWGRRRPWMLLSALPIGLTFIAIWVPPRGLSAGAVSLWIGVAILLFYTAMTTLTVPYVAFGAELSQGYHDRSRIFGARAIADNLGLILAAASIFLLERETDPRDAAVWIACVGATIMMASVLWPVLTIREPPEHQGRGGKKKPYSAFGDVLRNPHARLLLGVFFLETLGFQALVTIMPFLTEYILETPGQTALYLFGAIGATLLSIPAWIPLSRRFGKARVWTWSLVMKTIAFGVIGFIGAGDRIAIMLATVVFGVAAGAGAVLGPSLKADVIDTDEAATGERKEGTFFAAWGLAMKAATGLTILISGLTLDLVGFKPNAAQSEAALMGIRALSSVFPFCFHVLAIVLLLRFRLDENEYAKVRRMIDSRRPSDERGA
jgi:GPH family glycoside/pentoside/hexuronide:cation symporter